MGSELSAASGRGSEVSEWPRSKLGASAVRQRRNFGHRNRIIGPYGGVGAGAWVLRIATGAVRPRNDIAFARGTVWNRRADRGVRPYGYIIGGA